jgi:hypothetical protein
MENRPARVYAVAETENDGAWFFEGMGEQGKD